METERVGERGETLTNMQRMKKKKKERKNDTHRILTFRWGKWRILIG